MIHCNILQYVRRESSGSLLWDALVQRNGWMRTKGLTTGLISTGQNHSKQFRDLLIGYFTSPLNRTWVDLVSLWMRELDAVSFDRQCSSQRPHLACPSSLASKVPASVVLVPILVANQVQVQAFFFFGRKQLTIWKEVGGDQTVGCK